MQDAISTFDRKFQGWAQAHQQATGHASDADALLAALRLKLPGDTLRLIGSAFINGWLTNGEGARGYFVRESDRLGPGGGQPMLYHAGGGKVVPWLEAYIQLADYATLRTVAESRGL